MNARQRRKRRRARGIRPPHTCVWCSTTLPTIQSPCACEKDPRPRKPFLDLTLHALAVKAWERGYDMRCGSYEYTPLERIANPWSDALGKIFVIIEPKEG